MEKKTTFFSEFTTKFLFIPIITIVVYDLFISKHLFSYIQKSKISHFLNPKTILSEDLPGYTSNSNIDNKTPLYDSLMKVESVSNKYLIQTYKHVIIKNFDQTSDFINTNELGSYLKATLVSVNGRVIMLPPFGNMGIELRTLNHNFTVSEKIDKNFFNNHLINGDVLTVVAAMESFMRLSGRRAMRMSEFVGYKTFPKDVVGVLSNSGDKFMVMLNPKIVSRSLETEKIRYVPARCQQKSVVLTLNKKIRVEFLKLEDHYGEKKILEIKESWHSGHTGYSLQAIIPERDLCSNKF